MLNRQFINLPLINPLSLREPQERLLRVEGEGGCIKGKLGGFWVKNSSLALMTDRG